MVVAACHIHLSIAAGFLHNDCLGIRSVVTLHHIIMKATMHARLVRNYILVLLAILQHASASDASIESMPQFPVIPHVTTSRQQPSDKTLILHLFNFTNALHLGSSGTERRSSMRSQTV